MNKVEKFVVDLLCVAVSILYILYNLKYVFFSKRFLHRPRWLKPQWAQVRYSRKALERRCALTEFGSISIWESHSDFTLQEIKQSCNRDTKTKLRFLLRDILGLQIFQFQQNEEKEAADSRVSLPQSPLPPVARSHEWYLMIKSLHSTLYTVRVRVSHWAQLKTMLCPRASVVGQKLKNVFKEVHRSHDVLILRGKTTGKNNERARERWERTSRGGGLTFWQQSMNSSMVTTPSLFLSIFCWTQRRRKRWETHRDVLLKPLYRDRRADHLPGRKLRRADEAPPPWGRGTCTSPSCHRWPSWCQAFPVTRGKTDQLRPATHRLPRVLRLGDFSRRLTLTGMRSESLQSVKKWH